MADKNMNQYDEATYDETLRLWVTADPTGTPVLKRIDAEDLNRGHADYRLFTKQEAAPTEPGEDYVQLYAGEDGKLYSQDDEGNISAIGEGVLAHMMNARLTPTTAVPVELTEKASQTTVFWTPFMGKAVRLYDGELWKNLNLTEDSFLLTDDTQTCTTSAGSAVISALTDTSKLVVGMEVTGVGIQANSVISSINNATQVTLDKTASADGSTIAVTFKVPANKRLDLFGEISGGAAKLRRPVMWTNLTTRATALTTQDGVTVLTGEDTAIYLGWVQTGATAGQFGFTLSKAAIVNHYHADVGWKPAYIPITAMRPADTNGAGAISELSGGLLARAFDPDTAEYVSIILKAPANWSGVVAPRLYWTVNDTNSGNVRWRWRLQAAANGENLDTVTNELIQLSAAPGTAQRVVITSLGTAITREDGDLLRIDLYRDATNGADTYAADAHAIGLELYFLMHGDGVTAVP